VKVEGQCGFCWTLRRELNTRGGEVGHRIMAGWVRGNKCRGNPANKNKLLTGSGGKKPKGIPSPRQEERVY